jgi:hypothetical protein
VAGCTRPTDQGDAVMKYFKLPDLGEGLQEAEVV